MKKLLVVFFFLLSFSAHAGVWSKTSIEIATSTIPPFVNARMTATSGQITAINSFYKSRISAEHGIKEDHLNDIKTLEVMILTEMKEFNHNQKRINLMDKKK